MKCYEDLESLNITPLVNIQKTMENHQFIAGYINYFNGHFPVRKLYCKRLPEGKVAVPNGMLKSMELEWTKCVFSNMFRCSVPVFLQSSSYGTFRAERNTIDTLFISQKYPKVHKASQSTLWLFNIAMENGPFIDGLPIRNSDFPWQTVSHNQRVLSFMNPKCTMVLECPRNDPRMLATSPWSIWVPNVALNVDTVGKSISTINAINHRGGHGSSTFHQLISAQTRIIIIIIIAIYFPYMFHIYFPYMFHIFSHICSTYFPYNTCVYIHTHIYIYI